jgi:hypothetical protein
MNKKNNTMADAFNKLTTPTTHLEFRAKVRLVEIYGKEEVFGAVETVTIRKNEDKTFTFHCEDYFGRPLEMGHFDLFHKKKMMFLNHRYHAEHGAYIVSLDVD